MTGPRAPLLLARPRRSTRRRWVRGTVLALAGGALLLLLAGVGLWRYAESRITRLDLPSLGEEAQRDLAVPIEGTLTALVVGIDSRAGLTPEQLQRLGTVDHGAALTDTIILVQVSPAREQVVLVSFPRDLLVTYQGQRTKINAVHARGGPDGLIATVQDFTGVAIDHYVEVDLAGFLRLTDAIGGVTVCAEERLVDRPAGLDLPAGCHELDGVQAVSYVRARHLSDRFGTGDFGRIARQQYFLRQALDKVTSAGTLLNPIKLKRLIDAVATSLTLDEDLGVGDLYRLASALESLDPADVEMRVVPGYWRSPYVYAYPEQSEALFQALREGGPLPPVGMTAPEAVQPGDVRVAIYNGTDVTGLATATAELLRDRGFVVTEVGNAPTPTAVTTITYGPGRRIHAELLAVELPGARLVEGVVPDGVDVVVTLGADRAEEVRR